MEKYTAKIMKFGVANANGRIYPKELADEIINEINKGCGGTFGERDPYMPLSIGNMSHVCNNAKLSSDDLWVECTISPLKQSDEEKFMLMASKSLFAVPNLQVEFEKDGKTVKSAAVISIDILPNMSSFGEECKITKIED